MILSYNNQNYRVYDDNGSYDINKVKIGLTLSQTSKGSYRAITSEKSYDVLVANDEEFLYLFIEGKQFTFRKISEDNFNHGIDSSDMGTGEIHAPMPGSVVKVLVKVGDKVEIGTPVLIIEAMKMESTLYADIEGVVTAVNAIGKEQVGTEKALVVIESVKK
ncbi:MAG: acetyl-CoA carboxylase biotin carboxyl carrier protein subunit [Desulfobulbaceae bacterium]|nr:acetyl-CoA carboxylase biotin carboxyl carrier protein subunit [Desulfobulbaceae bacterium]